MNDFEDRVAWRRSTKVQHVCFGITFLFCIMCYEPNWWYSKLSLWWPSWVLCAYIKVFHRFGNGRPKVSGWLVLPQLAEILGESPVKNRVLPVDCSRKSMHTKKKRKEKKKSHTTHTSLGRITCNALIWCYICNLSRYSRE